MDKNIFYTPVAEYPSDEEATPLSPPPPPLLTVQESTLQSPPTPPPLLTKEEKMDKIKTQQQSTLQAPPLTLQQTPPPPIRLTPVQSIMQTPPPPRLLTPLQSTLRTPPPPPLQTPSAPPQRTALQSALQAPPPPPLITLSLLPPLPPRGRPQGPSPATPHSTSYESLWNAAEPAAQETVSDVRPSSTPINNSYYLFSSPDSEDDRPSFLPFEGGDDFETVRRRRRSSELSELTKRSPATKNCAADADRWPERKKRSLFMPIAVTLGVLLACVAIYVYFMLRYVNASGAINN